MVCVENRKSPSENHSWTFSLPARLRVSPRVAFFFIINFVRICNGLIGETDFGFGGGRDGVALYASGSNRFGAVMCSNPAGCDSLPQPPPFFPHMLQLFLLCPRGEHDSCWCTAQARMVTSPLLGCLCKSFIYCLFCRHPVARDTGREEIWLCSLGTPLSICVVKFCSHGGGNPSKRAASDLVGHSCRVSLA